MSLTEIVLCALLVVAAVLLVRQRKRLDWYEESAKRDLANIHTLRLINRNLVHELDDAKAERDAANERAARVYRPVPWGTIEERKSGIVIAKVWHN